jgi:hypothetical protein
MELFAKMVCCRKSAHVLKHYSAKLGDRHANTDEAGD